METVALFGGSYDPPHLGHKAIVEALENLSFIDKIVLVPAFLNPFKEKSFALPEQRLKWLQTIFEAHSQVIVEDYELQKKRKVPTIETVNYLLKQYKKVYLVIGADNLKNLHRWYKFDELQAKVTFIIATRDAIEVPKEFITLNIDKNISSTELREKIETQKISQKCAEEIAQHYKENNAK